MKNFSRMFSVSTHKRMEILDVTNNVAKIVGESGITNGIVHVWVPHATAAVAVNEHDTDLWDDVLEAFSRLVPFKGDYHHNAKYSWTESEQNAHAHILNCLIKPHVTVPLENGEMQLGTWQSILLIEMDGSRTRHIRVHVIGE
ncbi:secondary thiamine-phosphate synthase enzyme YjbQ [Candidatus Bathyarchaeota archaeon]|nr:secondary thiamine-phosphate synthase enzyme YjbQ [Candidatus Bathyarchaeota archaeon]